MLAGQSCSWNVSRSLLTLKQPQTHISCWTEFMFWVNVAVEQGITTTVLCKVEQVCFWAEFSAVSVLFLSIKVFQWVVWHKNLQSSMVSINLFIKKWYISYLAGLVLTQSNTSSKVQEAMMPNGFASNQLVKDFSHSPVKNPKHLWDLTSTPSVFFQSKMILN